MTCEESIKWLDNLIKTLGQAQYQSLWNWEQPLTEIKEMLESKRVVELPCKVGDTVYWIYRKGGKPYISEEIVQNIYCDVRETLEFIILNPNNRILKSNVFLTKSEAEQKLKELQNG